MNLERDLARIALQEERLQFQRFDAATAWTIGTRLREVANAHAYRRIVWQCVLRHNVILRLAALDV